MKIILSILLVINVLLIIAVLLYTGLKLMSVFRYFKCCNPWLAFVPYVNLYQYSKLTAADDQGNVQMFNTLQIPMKFYKHWWLLLLVLSAFISNWFACLISLLITAIFFGKTTKDVLDTVLQDESVYLNRQIIVTLPLLMLQ